MLVSGHLMTVGRSLSLLSSSFRLSSQPSLINGLMSGSALERLVELSVCKKARLDSDSTLVAVITAVSEGAG